MDETWAEVIDRAFVAVRRTVRKLCAEGRLVHVSKVSWIHEREQTDGLEVYFEYDAFQKGLPLAIYGYGEPLAYRGRPLTETMRREYETAASALQDMLVANDRILVLQTEVERLSKELDEYRDEVYDLRAEVRDFRRGGDND